MSPDLVLRYRHDLATAQPHYLSHHGVEELASLVRRQLGADGIGEPAFGFDRLTSIRRLQVNEISFDLDWSTAHEVTDGCGNPVLGICEHDPAIPDTTLIHINPHVVDGRDELVLSTGAHELGHAVFEAPGWIQASRDAAEPGLFGVLEATTVRQVFRTTTANEQHLTANYERGSPLFFQETRANEFMGALLVPRQLLTERFFACCRQIEVDVRRLLSPSLQCQLAVADEAPPDKEALADPGWLAVQLYTVTTLLAPVFGVTRRFIEVRLKRYGLIPQQMLLA